MSQKTNEALSINIEAMENYMALAVTLSQVLDTQTETIEAAVRYLTSEENISGGDAEEFVKGVNIINMATTETKRKFAVLSQAAKNLAEAMKATSSLANRSLSQIRDDIAVTKSKITAATTEG